MPHRGGSDEADSQPSVTEGDPSRLYRSMKLGSDGLPELGESARTLGARPGTDIPLDENGVVVPGTGGASITPGDPMQLPSHRRPSDHGGTGRDPVFSLDPANLPDGLQFRPDPNNPTGHGFLEPSRPMNVDEYQHALARTRSLWEPYRH